MIIYFKETGDIFGINLRGARDIITGNFGIRFQGTMDFQEIKVPSLLRTLELLPDLGSQLLLLAIIATLSFYEGVPLRDVA